MKRYINTLICVWFVFTNGALFSQKQKIKLPESTYFNFQSDPVLNAHLFLYNKAMGCKFKKVHNDSLAWYSFKDKLKGLPPADLVQLNPVLEFYRDSLIGKDLLFDSLMRDFSDKLINPGSATVKWQTQTRDKINIFSPYFLKLYWPGIETENKNWLNANMASIVRLEAAVIPELERIYATKLPEGKIRVDLTCYATWAGAYSYNDAFCHVIFSSPHHSNQADMAPEVVFHETSHFLVDKLEKEIKTATKGKDIKQSINLWHNMIFYTTGYVLEKEYAKENKTFVPYYVQMKFEDKFPDFKACVEACKTHWDTYIQGKISMQESVKSIVSYMLEKK